MALEFFYWQSLFQKAQKERDAEFRERLSQQPEQDALRAQFAEVLADDGFRAGDFRKRGWDSLLSVTAMRKFAADQFDWPSLDEKTVFSDNKLDYDALAKVHEKVANSTLQRTKLEDAASSISGRGKIVLNKVVERFF